jgi:hypothetical protein
VNPALQGAARQALTRAALALPLALGAIAFFFCVYYVLQIVSPLLMSDAWYFADRWLLPMHEGTLTFADLWAKRPANHAQPLTALLFLANARWFGLDFSLEALLVLALAAAFAGLLVRLGFAQAPTRGALARAWFAGAVLCTVFSVNASDKLAWTLVGLFYLGHLLGLGLLSWVARRRAALPPVRAFCAALVICGLLDTSGVLWCAAAAALLLLTRAPESRARLSAWRGAVAIAAAVPAYRLLYAWLAPPMDGPPLPSLALSLSGLAQQGADAWQIVLPFGAALAHPWRLQQLYGPGDYTLSVMLLALLCLAAHAVLWWHALRRPIGTGVAVACGLALFAYATLAGIVLQRVPAFGFDYLLQSRYAVFHEFLWLAPLLAWFCAAPAAAGTAQPLPQRLRRGTAAAVVLLPCAIAPLWWQPAWFELPWIRAWNDDLARDTWQVLQDPEQVPAACHPHVLICGYEPAVRRRLAALLQAGPYNLADPALRGRHGLDPVLREPPR